MGYLNPICHDLTTGFTGDIIVHNNQLVIPGEKTGEGISGGFLQFLSPMNVTISNNFMSLFTFGAEFQPTVSILYYTIWCNMQDEMVQIFSFVNNTV